MQMAIAEQELRYSGDSYREEDPSAFSQEKNRMETSLAEEEVAREEKIAVAKSGIAETQRQFEEMHADPDSVAEQVAQGVGDVVGKIAGLTGVVAGGLGGLMASEGGVGEGFAGAAVVGASAAVTGKEIGEKATRKTLDFFGASPRKRGAA